VAKVAGVSVKRDVLLTSAKASLHDFVLFVEVLVDHKLHKISDRTEFR
jgi:hypothetical protein